MDSVHHFGSKFLIDSLHAHGFCSSYATVLQYERNAAVAQGTDLPGHISDQFIQYVADNVDHNTRILDGKGTFHGRGIIATITPGGRISKLVPKKDVSPEELAAAGETNICHYRNQAGHTTPLFYKELKDLRIEDASANLDLIWKMTQPMGQHPWPGWLGFMQVVCEGHYPGQSTISFLPMIDLEPTDMTCVYFTLSFICDHAKRYSVTSIVTFDQPLWWKAMIIVTNEPETSDLKSVVLRLGGLHIEMSFLGCIGHVMAGSGLKEVLELVYAANAVGHMLSGKALARAVRGHFLVDSALNALLVNVTFDSPLPATIGLDTETGVNLADKEGELNASHVQAADQDLKKVEELYKELVKDTRKAKQVGSTEVLQKITEKLESKRFSMHNQRTATLWIQYMNMVDTLRTFMKAERTGNWNLHLQTVREMLPYFAAAGHNKYVKSAYLYLQLMCDLHKTHPDVHKSFQNGLHVVRRSDLYWSGLSTDLVIEQVLMRGLKTSGGLTRGRGMTEAQRLAWVMSMPACAEVNSAMQNPTDIVNNTSEQHKEATKARQERGHKDAH